MLEREVGEQKKKKICSKVINKTVGYRHPELKNSSFNTTEKKSSKTPQLCEFQDTTKTKNILDFRI